MEHEEREYFRSRRERLLARLADAGFYGALISRPEDRRYLSGFTGSSGLLLLTREEAILFTDFRYLEQAGRECPGVRVVDHERKPEEAVVRAVCTSRPARVAFQGDAMSVRAYERLLAVTREVCPEVRWEDAGEALEGLRVRKDPPELAKIRRAVEIAEAAFRAVLPEIRPGRTERQVAWALERAMREAGAEATAFPPIVVSGVRGSLPHGMPTDKPLACGELVTLDFGAVYEGYVSDLTRTVALCDPPEALLRIYETVLAAQLRAVARVRAGVTAEEVDAAARETIERAGYGKYFGHATGHGIGLAVHEDPTIGPGRATPLKAGSVVTIEPGIYVPDLGGVRIEDDVLVGESGAVLLSTLPKELLRLR
ncbi:M24 family metallopeptidase [Brockia lithotrophica]|uniref:Xaa-Pro aminopeptidase/Xaa-Pro dipeptidase n=1 Tax=Brockia lithotrophica TaxID=933949 RepID=A0A660L406_9BACL|nr:Xaa-Pro peptidase family protein [Brockia lithotrophica]RKQ88751.1 Xaa-Pro aminopeptidase/Xaa-Pro dipeptidase [Brockia lithotrophica]